MVTAEQRAVFPPILAEAIRNADVSQLKLAGLIGVAGSTINQYAAGKIVPSVDRCAELERALGLEPDELASHLGYTPPSSGERNVTPEEAIMAADWIHPRVKDAILAALAKERRAAASDD